MVVDFPHLVSRVNRRDSRVAKASERTVERGLDGGVDGALGLFAVPSAKRLTSLGRVNVMDLYPIVPRLQLVG